jgi:O-antigen ligase
MSCIILTAIGLYWFHFRTAWRGLGGKLAAAVLGASIIIGSVFFVSKMPSLVRMTRTIGESGQFEKEARFRWFIRGLEITARHPIFGLGVNGFAIMGESGHFGTFSHSTITETLTGTGIPGFILYFGSQVSMFLMIWRLRKVPLPRGDMAILDCCLCIFLIYLVYHVFAVVLGGKFGWPLMAGICGYCHQLQKNYLPRA